MTYETSIWFFRQDENNARQLHQIEDTEYKPIYDTLSANTPGVELSYTKCGTLESYSEWPSLLSDMLSLSRIFKDIVIQLHFINPDVPDGEMMFFLDGKRQVALGVTIWQHFDPEQLEDVEEELI